MMSERQYKVAILGVMQQIKLAQKLHCPHMEAKHKAALVKLQRRYLKPDHQELSLDGKVVFYNHYHI